MIAIKDIHQLGQLMRQQRRKQHLRQDDLADALGTSHVFLRKVERGEAQQLQRLFALLDDLGIKLYATTPDSPLDSQTDA